MLQFNLVVWKLRFSWKVGLKLKKLFDDFNKKSDKKNVGFNFSGNLNNSNNFNNSNKNVPKVFNRRNRFIFLIILLILVSAVVGGVTGRLVERYFFDLDYRIPSNVHIEGNSCSSGEAVALKASPSVVGIRSVILDKGGQKKAASFPFKFPIPFFGDVEDDDEGEEDEKAEGEIRAYGAGSGVIYEVKDDFAYIVTNFHVVKMALQNSGNSVIEVYFGKDVKKYTSANVVDYNPAIDIAVLKVPLEGKKVSCVELGDSDKLNAGQEIYVIGKPNGYNLSVSVTHGIVSALKRFIKLEGVKNETETFQIDAPINHGNSGGGIFDKNGKLIGICVAKMASKVSILGKSAIDLPEGMGFCLPINPVDKTVRKIIDGSNGNVIKKMPTLGIIMESDNDSIFGSKFINGVFVKGVMPGSVAEKAGIQAGDIIVEIDGQKITCSGDLDSALSSKRDKKGKITVLRQSSRRGKIKKINIDVTFD